jgi:hypothetical protein
MALSPNTRKQRRIKYAENRKKSMCRGKRVKPNKCTRIKHCKVAKGTKRSYCRKKHATRYHKK